MQLFPTHPDPWHRSWLVATTRYLILDDSTMQLIFEEFNGWEKSIDEWHAMMNDYLPDHPDVEIKRFGLIGAIVRKKGTPPGSTMAVIEFQRYPAVCSWS